MAPSDSAPQPTAHAAIALRGLRLSLGRRLILDDVDLTIAPGERVALIGPSGSGKSTLLRCVGGLERPDAGRVTIFGTDLTEGRAAVMRARRRMALIFQQFNLYSLKTVLENVALAPIAVAGMRRAAAEEWARDCLARVGIDGFEARYPFQISGGQQQRVAIARALAMRPDILMLDEPTSALDPELVQSMLELIQSLAESGMTILCVTHEIGFARRLADQVHFMAEGRVLESGRPAALLDAPRSERLKTFLAHLSRPGGAPGALKPAASGAAR